MGPPIIYEPNNLDALHTNIEVFSIFHEARWIEYFQRLNGFHEEMTFQFTMKLTGEHSKIRGLRVDVAEVTRLPRIGNRWFCWKKHNLIAIEDILVAGEHV